MLSLVGSIVSAVQLCAFALYILEYDSWYYAAVVCGANLYFTVVAIWQHNPLLTAVMAAITLLWALVTWLDWKNRKKKKRKRLLSRLGYKGRAALRKVIARMPRPRAPRIRVPVPVPG